MDFSLTAMREAKLRPMDWKTWLGEDECRSSPVKELLTIFMELLTVVVVDWLDAALVLVPIGNSVSSSSFKGWPDGRANG